MTDSWTAQWMTALDEFPLGGSPSQLLRGLIQYGIMAPSSHNAQPWRFRLRPEVLELRLDPQRHLPISDAAGRELRVACGTAIGNMEIAAQHFGFHLKVELLPNPVDRELLARMRVGPSQPPTEQDHRLFAALPHRHTVRRPYDATPLPIGIKMDLAEIAAGCGAWLEFVDDHRDREELAELITKADRIQLHDPAFREELARWWASTPVVVRTFEIGDGRAAYHQALVSGSPALMVLGTPHDRQLSWLEAGRALARVLLLATHHGIRSSFLNQPVEVALLRNQVRGLLTSEGHPQLIMRMGYGPEGRPTPRRSVEEVLEQDSCP